MLFEGRFDPMTWGWGFIRAPATQVAAEFRRWQKSLDLPVKQKRSCAGLEGNLLALAEKLTTGPTVHLFQQTENPAWSAYFRNSRSSQTYPVIRVVSDRLSTEGISITHRARAGKSGHASLQFQYHFGDRNRAIATVCDDGRWTFDLVGDPFDFEETRTYRAKRIKDRLTPEMLDRYCAQFGLRLFDPEFYGNDGQLVTVDLGQQGEPLSVVRERLGLS